MLLITPTKNADKYIVFPQKMSTKTDEFDNFLYRVTEVTDIIKKLASSDKQEQQIGNLEARRYLGEDKEEIYEKLENNQELLLKVKENKIGLNRKALIDDNKDANTKSQEAFMKEVEEDANRRYNDRLIRTERMETLKKQANKAFRRGEYEKALVLFNKAIEQIKDSPLLYNNRALTFIKLKRYEKAKDDLENWALRLNEDNVKSWLLLSKVNFLTNNLKEYEKCVREASERNPEDVNLINDYVKELEGNNKEV